MNFNYYSSFVSMEYYQNPNHKYTTDSLDHNHFDGFIDPFDTEFQVSDYLILNDEFGDDYMSSESMVSSNQIVGGSSGSNSSVTSKDTTIKHKQVAKETKKEARNRVAFRTKSEIDVMSDGFKWRKYGKKKVKNSPHLRNYYKCSNEGCNVKKRVERDREDSRFVITMYENVHNHDSPGVYYNSSDASLLGFQASSSLSSSSS